MSPMMGVGFFELLVLLSMGGSLGGVLGMPPGERDEALARTAPANSVLYVEWSERTAGQAGALGVEGLAADPEVREFLADLERAIRDVIQRETQDSSSPEERIAGKTVPVLFRSALTHAGCLWLRFDAAAGAKAVEAHQGGGPPTSWAALALGARAALVINAGDEADAFAKELTELLEVLPIALREEGLARRKLLPPEAWVELVLHREGKHFVLALGEGTLDSVLAGLEGKAQGLAGEKRFQEDFARIAMDRVASVSWLDVKAALEAARAALGDDGAIVPAMAETLGLDQVGTVTSCTALVEGRIRTRTFIQTNGGEKGLLALAAGKPIEPRHFELIPADADFVTVGSLDAQKALAAVREMVGSTAPDALQTLNAIIAQLETELGVKERDLFAAFGDVWTIYDCPSGGGLFLTGAVASLEVRDPQQAYATFSQVMKVLAAAMPGETGERYRRRAVFLAERKFLDRTIYYVNTVGDDVPFAPAFCVTDKQLLVALHPQGIKAHLRFLAGEGKEGERRASWRPSAIPEGELIGVSYLDSPAIVRALYALAPWFGQLIASEMQRDRFELDVFSLPSARAVLPYIQPSNSFAVRRKDGLLFQRDDGIPFQQGVGWMAKVSVLMGAVRYNMMLREFGPPGGAPVPLRAIPAAKPLPVDPDDAAVPEIDDDETALKPFLLPIF
ncbi:MAG: hypothetical protein WED34_11510 [Planctomycetales bacterium]